MKTLKVACFFLVVLIGVQLVKNWHKLPFNQKAKKLEAIEVIASVTSDAHASLEVSNLGYEDVIDPEVSCEVFGQSGTRLEERTFTVYYKLHPLDTATVEKAFPVDNQAHVVACVTVDGILPETINGKPRPTITVKRVTKDEESPQG